MPSTILLSTTVGIVQTSKGMKPLTGVGGVANQPALEICNNTLQRLLSAPYDWRFNRNAIPPFTTIAYQQDYVISGCSVYCKGRYIIHLNAVISPNGPGLTQAGTTVTALFNDFAPNGLPVGGGPAVGDIITVAGANQSPYNISSGVITAVLSPVSFTYEAAFGGLFADGGQGFSNPGINWLSHVSLVDFQASGNIIPVHDAEIASSLFMESITQPPIKFANQIETVYSSGGAITPGQSSQQIVVHTMRAWPVPSTQVWGVYLFFQAKAPMLTSLSGTWAPWPDDLSFVLTSNVKAVALDWWEDPRSVNSLLLADRDILKALGSKDQEPRAEGMFPDMPILRGG
jgi:hypothetical protein